MTNCVKISVACFGDAVCGATGYVAIKHDDVCTFYVDGWGSTGRIYPVASSSSVFTEHENVNCPSITIENGEDNTTLTEIFFPEFEGWEVFSMSGGKTMSVCLIKPKF